jgi:2'-5' RNA ligase
MPFADLAPGQNAERVRNHWWWRPGWRLGRQVYAWHFTFDDAHQLHDLACQYRQSLDGLSGADPVPDEWLHLTVQGIGFIDDVSDADRDAMIDAAARRLSALSPVTAQLGPAVVADEAIALPVEPAPLLKHIRTEARAAIADVWGPSRVPEDAARFRPHVSVAYLNTAGTAEPYISAVATVRTQPAIATIRKLSLIRMTRDHRMYEWETVATIPLGMTTPTTAE